MITLFTGLPGNGKTLFALATWHDKALAESREVYYSGIKDLMLPWTEIKAEEWNLVPDGALVLLDEAQFVFPRKPNGAQLPEFYTELAVHRHRGLDIGIITQHPTLIDNFVRKLVGQHFHSIRKFGMERATIHEWSATQAAPESPAAHKSSISKSWKYDKRVYGWYKSAEVHTVKRKIPAKLLMVAVFVIAVICALVMFVRGYGAKGQPAAGAGVSSSSPAGDAGGGGVGEKVFDPLADARQYAAMNTARIEGLPHTAPKYDELTKPVRVPVPAACVQIGVAGRGKVACKCYTQQGTPMAVEFNMCVEFARNGYFQDFDAEKDRRDDHRAAQGVQVLSARPDSPVSRERVADPSNGAIALAFADVPAQGGLGANPPPKLNDGPSKADVRSAMASEWGSVK